MFELSNTRMNPHIDPQLTLWGWEIPVYLFLGGMVAGMMIIAGYYLIKGSAQKKNSILPMVPFLGLILLSLGMLALFLDLEHKLYFWRLYTTFQVTSPMSWGAWILILVYPALVILWIANPPQWLIAMSGFVAKYHAQLQSKKQIVGLTNIILGVLLGMYTGVLLSSLGARPLWSSSMLWLLFLVSGLSSAAAFIHLITKSKEESEQLMKLDTVFLISELVVFGLLIIGYLNATAAQIDAIKLLLNGVYAPVFWVFVIGIGVLLPMVIQIMKWLGKIDHSPVAPLLVIAGGLMLRFLFVYAGQYSHWMIKF